MRKTGTLLIYRNGSTCIPGRLIRFAFQYGLSLEEANEVTLDTYITLRNDLRSLDENTPLLLTLYKILLEKLSRYNPTLPIPEDVLPFKEDALLHMKIVELNINIVSLLSYLFFTILIMSKFQLLSEITQLMLNQPFKMQMNFLAMTEKVLNS